MSREQYDQFAFYFFIGLALLLFAQSYINLVKKKTSGFGFDALVLLYVWVVRGKSIYEHDVRLLRKEPNRLQILGLGALLGAFAALYLAYDWYTKNLS